MPTATDISPKSTMQEILAAYPSAKKALFARYHVGGCASCGFQPTDTLEQVLQNHGFTDTEEAIALIQKSQDAADKLQISVHELSKLLKQGAMKLIDVRPEQEHRMVHIEGDLLATRQLAEEITERWPKDTAIVLYCHYGNSSLDAAMHLTQLGFTQVKSLQGGIDAWSQEIDPLTPRY